MMMINLQKQGSDGRCPDEQHLASTQTLPPEFTLDASTFSLTSVSSEDSEAFFLDLIPVICGESEK